MLSPNPSYPEPLLRSGTDPPSPVISPQTWSHVEAAILERVDAVELFLADVAGRFRFQSQMNASDHVLASVLAAREHLADSQPSFQRRIWLASTDLVCDSQGQFWFVDDHYCCPFGLYRLQQLLQEPRFMDPAESFVNFTRAARNSLQQFTGPDVSAVVLGSDTFNTAYHEHHFFADLLGIPFVSQRRLKTERHGLFHVGSSTRQRVSLVIRRLQDDDLDPACFRPDSLQGVQGLVRTSGRGLVTVLNAPGTSLFNSRALCRLIPQMVRFYLGHEPRLPTVPTVEAGSHSDRAKAVNRMSQHIFRTDSSMDLLKPLVGATCTAQQLATYLERIESTPDRFVIRSTLATASGGNTEAAYSLRAFCVGTGEHTVFNGGVMRRCATDGTPIAPITNDPTATPLLVAATS